MRMFCRQESNDAVAREVNLESGEAIAFACDVRDENAVKNVIESVYKEFGTIDILINNAGIVQCLPIDELKSDSIARTFEVNVYAHFWTIRAVISKFKVFGDRTLILPDRIPFL